MSNIEARERGFMPSPYDYKDIFRDRYYGPDVDFEETFKLIGKIPEGEWAVPEPYKSEDADKILTRWVVFIDRVTTCEEDYRINEKRMKEGKGIIVDGDTQKHKLHNDYRSVTSARVKKRQVLKHLKSVRKGFITLLSKSARKELGVKRLPKVKPEDIENVKHLVDMFNQKYGGLPYGYCRVISPSK